MQKIIGLQSTCMCSYQLTCGNVTSANLKCVFVLAILEWETGNLLQHWIVWGEENVLAPYLHIYRFFLNVSELKVHLHVGNCTSLKFRSASFHLFPIPSRPRN